MPAGCSLPWVSSPIQWLANRADCVQGWRKQQKPYWTNPDSTSQDHYQNESLDTNCQPDKANAKISAYLYKWIHLASETWTSRWSLSSIALYRSEQKSIFLVQTSIQRPMNLNLFRGERIGSLIPVSPAPEAPNAYKLRAYACSIEDRPNEIRSESVF